MNDILSISIETVNKSKVAYCKFITPNDTGATKAHQSGYHIHKLSWKLFFDAPGAKGENKDKFVTIKWQNDFTTKSRFIYYGKESRNEYRLTRFGRGFPFLNDNNIGDLLILCKIDEENYSGFILSTEDDIEYFLAAVGVDITEVNNIIPKTHSKAEPTLEEYFNSYINKLKVTFPPSIDISQEAQRIYNIYKKISQQIIKTNSDQVILGWLDIEYQLFKAIEINRYAKNLEKGFKNVDSLIEFSNTILNRRKSRAGKSLENHLSSIFTSHQLHFDTQKITEGRKKPDFIFPGIKEYHNLRFAFENLTFLGAKTTCKDRWRQILNEASRIPQKHLFTLQQGISSNQLQEMQDENITLVVPSNYHKFFPEEYRGGIMSLSTFINYVKEKQA